MKKESFIKEVSMWIPSIILLVIAKVFFSFKIFILKIFGFTLIFIGLILAFIASYNGFKKGLLSYKRKKEKFQKSFYLISSIIHYIFLMIFVALFFSYLFILISPYGENKLIDGAKNKSIDLGGIKAVNFHIVTLTTLGYGNTFPEGNIFETLSSLEALIGFGINIVFITIAISEITKNNKR